MMQYHFSLVVAGITIRLLALVIPRSVDFEARDWRWNSAGHLSVGWGLAQLSLLVFAASSPWLFLDSARLAQPVEHETLNLGVMGSCIMLDASVTTHLGMLVFGDLSKDQP
ncbi:hypothetical protein TNCV_208731 [Trichonephila clavipes]|uniref:Uncharacterized protein n=1 Tax=Trichonephila clavipes TaxID=2585209 RepID=A0A8X6T4V4_TRICX|nr:hypothetical protein TNCV_208731 [Trichonephila clavipes]